MDKKSGSSIAVPLSGSPSGLKQSLGSQEKSHQSTAQRKVGILTHSVKEKKEEKGEEGYYEIKLYVVNIDDSILDGAGDVVDPLVHFNLPYRSSDIAVCVWSSTIYLFWGYTYLGTLVPDDEPQKDAKKFGLPEAKTVLTKEQCQEKFIQITNMKYPKGCVRAVPTPDGEQILVFGYSVPIAESWTAFELYDPKEDSWEQFPGLSLGSCYCDCPHCCCAKWVNSYSFIDETHFFVKLGRRRSFLLDLISKKWTEIVIQDDPWISDYFLTAKSCYVLTPKCAFKLESDDFVTCGAGRRSFLPGPDFRLPNFKLLFLDQESDSYRRLPSIHSLRPFIQEEGEEEICSACILHIAKAHYRGKQGKKELGVVATLSLDVCRTKLPSLVTDVSDSVSLDIEVYYFLRSLSLISI